MDETQGGGIGITTLFTVCGAVATFFAGAVVALWKIIDGHRKATLERADALEKRNHEMVGQMTEVKYQVGMLEGRQQGIEQTCELAMKTVRDAILDKQEKESGQ